MLRPASRILARPALVRPVTRNTPVRRFLSTAPPSQQSRSWRNYTVRLGLAGAVIYYYNTTDVFAEEPSLAHLQPQAEPEEPLPTIEALAEQRKLHRAQAAASQQADVALGSEGQSAPAPSGTDATSVEELEEEAGQQGAFNPETGEINWDCPCLGGMADGPCGPQFKEAFSCFVYSNEEPKGMDCIDKFKNMQDCFRLHPDIYGAELEDDLEEQSRELDGEAQSRDPEAAAAAPKAEVDTSATVPDAKPPASKSEAKINTSEERPVYTHGDKVAAAEPAGPSDDPEVQEKRRIAKQVAKEVNSQEQTSESEALVPKAAHDAR